MYADEIVAVAVAVAAAARLGLGRKHRRKTVGRRGPARGRGRGAGPRKATELPTGYDTYIHSPAWRTRRLELLRAARWTCQCCRQPSSRLEAHHVTYRHLGDERPGELVVLCGPCHRWIHDLARTHRLSVERATRLALARTLKTER